MDKSTTEDAIEAHLETIEPECRWYFAIDMRRVQGKVVAQYNFPDATVLHLSCPRCGGEFSKYIPIWEGEYLRNRIYKLHPKLSERLEDKQPRKIVDRVFPEYTSGQTK